MPFIETLPRSMLMVAAAAALGACAPRSFYQPGDGGNATGRSGGGSSTGGGASSSGGAGTTTGGLVGCNPDPSNCPPANSQDPLNLCDAGDVELVANLVNFDFTKGTSPITCPILLTDFYNPSLAASTDLCGYIRLCIAPGTKISFTAQVGGYIPMNFATLIMAQSTQMPNRPGILMAQSKALQYLQLALPDADTSQAMVLVNVQPEVDGGSAQCLDKANWTLWLVDSGGSTVDAGVAYIIDDTPDGLASATDGSGIVFFYNVDPALGTVQPRGFRDGGACVNAETGPPLGLTGSVPLAGANLSVVPFVVK